MTEQEFKNLKIGDRIKALSNTFLKTKNICGTVVSTVVDANKENDTIGVKWDKDVGGWNKRYLGITNNNGEYIGLGHAINKYNLIVLKNNTNKINKYDLHITCQDGVRTTATYLIDGKIVSTSTTKRNIKEDDFDFETEVYNCIDNLEFNPKPRPRKGKELIGQQIKAGQRVRIINVEPHNDDKTDYVCLNEYIGKIGQFKYSFIFHEDFFDGSINFDKEYMNAIDIENGYLCWRWDEVELLDDDED